MPGAMNPVRFSSLFTEWEINTSDLHIPHPLFQDCWFWFQLQVQLCWIQYCNSNLGNLRWQFGVGFANFPLPLITSEGEHRCLDQIFVSKPTEFLIRHLGPDCAPKYPMMPEPLCRKPKGWPPPCIVCILVCICLEKRVNDSKMNPVVYCTWGKQVINEMEMGRGKDWKGTALRCVLSNFKGLREWQPLNQRLISLCESGGGFLYYNIIVYLTLFCKRKNIEIEG